MPSASWPEALAGTPAVVVIEHALMQRRGERGELVHHGRELQPGWKIDVGFEGKLS